MAKEQDQSTDHDPNAELATYLLKAGGHMDNYGPDDGEGNPGNTSGSITTKVVAHDGAGQRVMVDEQKPGKVRVFRTTNERNPAIFKSPQLDLHVRFPHKYQRLDGAAPIYKDNTKVTSVKPKNDMLESMTKNQLLAMAEEQEVDVTGITDKASLIKKLREQPAEAT
jgi:hypothetical protein